MYSFTYDLNNLNVVQFDCNLEWMLAICYYRGTVKEYSEKKMKQDIIDKTTQADLIIAPIADNKMFDVMEQFSDGDINADVALHSLSASKLGLQYVIKQKSFESADSNRKILCV